MLIPACVMGSAWIHPRPLLARAKAVKVAKPKERAKVTAKERRAKVKVVNEVVLVVAKVELWRKLMLHAISNTSPLLDVPGEISVDSDMISANLRLTPERVQGLPRLIPRPDEIVEKESLLRARARRARKVRRARPQTQRLPTPRIPSIYRRQKQRRRRMLQP